MGFPCVTLQPGCLKETSLYLQLFLSSCTQVQQVTAHCLKWQRALRSFNSRGAIKCKMMLLLLKKFISYWTPRVGRGGLSYSCCLGRGSCVNTWYLQRRGKAGSDCLQHLQSMDAFFWCWLELSSQYLSPLLLFGAYRIKLGCSSWIAGFSDRSSWAYVSIRFLRLP